MGKILVTESELKRIISESVKQVLKEGQNDAYTLDQLLKDQNYNGNKVALVNNFLNPGLRAYVKSKGLKKVPNVRLDQARLSGRDWLNIFNFAASSNPSANQVLSNLVRGIQSTINAKSVSDGLKDAAARGATSNGIYDERVTVNPRNFTTIAQAVQHIARMNPNRTLSFKNEFTDSTGIFNGLDINQVQNTIAQKIRVAKSTLRQTNPNAATVLSTIEQWIGQGAQYLPAKQLGQAFGALEQILKTSRNDIPIVSGFQKLMRLFGTNLVVNGAIGQQTRAALQQAGYNDIFQFKADVEKVQNVLGLKPDGIVGPKTLGALSQNGITNMQEFKNAAGAQARMSQPRVDAVSGNAPGTDYTNMPIVQTKPRGGLAGQIPMANRG